MPHADLWIAPPATDRSEDCAYSGNTCLYSDDRSKNPDLHSCVAERRGPGMSVRVGSSATSSSFPKAATSALDNSQLRRNVKHATDIIQLKRKNMTGELPDWEELRSAGHAIKTHTLKYLDVYLEEFEKNFTKNGGVVHWACDADEANQIIRRIIQNRAGREVIKVKTMTSNEISLNEYLEEHGITPHETDLADLIVQLGRDRPSHIVVPALHINRVQIREIFEKSMPLEQ